MAATCCTTVRTASFLFEQMRVIASQVIRPEMIQPLTAMGLETPNDPQVGSHRVFGIVAPHEFLAHAF
jgi:hypothetical protein